MNNQSSAERNAKATVEKAEADFSIKGTSGLKQRSGVVREEFLRSLEGQKGVKAYVEMRDNEPIIGGWHRGFAYLMRKAPWFWQPRDGSTNEEAVEFGESLISDMSHSFADFMTELAQVPIFGWAYFEKVFKVRMGPDEKDPSRRSAFSDGKIGLRKLAIRPQTSLKRWEFDDDGGIRGMVQDLGGAREAFIPIEKAALFRTDTTKNNPEGRSWLRNCYDPYFRVKNFRDFEGISAERMGAGIPRARLPVQYMDANATAAQSTIRTYAENMVRGIRIDEQMGIVFPASEDHNGNKTGFDFDIISPPGKGFDFDTTIKRLETRMAMALMAEMMFLGLMNSGTRSLGDTKTDLVKLTTSTVLDDFEETFHRYVTIPLFLMNGYRSEDIPRYVHGAIDPVDLEQVKGFLEPMFQAAAIFPSAEMERKLIELANESSGANLPLPPEPFTSSVSEGASDGSEDESQVNSARDNRDALNGAQVDSMLRVLEAVAEGRLPRDTAIQMIARAFNMGLEDAEAIVGEIGNGFTPKAKQTPPVMSPVPMEEEEEDDGLPES